MLKLLYIDNKYKIYKARWHMKKDSGIFCYNESKTVEKVVKYYNKVPIEFNLYTYNNNLTDDIDKIAKKVGFIVKYVYKQVKGNVIGNIFRIF